MNALRNKVQLIGRLGDKIEMKTLESGKVVGRVNIATNEVYRNAKGEKITETTWTNLVIWGKNAEILDKYTDKGSEIAVEGKLSNRSYTDKNGDKKYITEVVVNEVLLLGGGTKAEKAQMEAEASDLPF
ncbi:single-stranded DNA-binding protein [Algoriphagus sp. AK58]|uniref:single-stranded DNA-binding protein n=1 Tax=Algoriphagus sp. AK58 TaxID=1406877 RepID=UPI00164F0127|nr:single-stranded DNA-binding protein [Algoriphagus sp. AK58]MBC6368560.1 single-stranded DNA-binding protein [Algoriphagus sp. AK58]